MRELVGLWEVRALVKVLELEYLVRMAVPQAESIYSFSTPEGKVLAGVTAVRARGRKGGRLKTLTLKTHKAGAGANTL